MKHGYVVLFDSLLRRAWYTNAYFPLSAALHASARNGTQLRAKESK